VIFSLGPACGCVITLSSYNKFSRNCHRDSILIAVSNSVTSFFSGVVVFSILGFMAREAGVDVRDVVKSGPGLAFIVYPQVVTLMPVSAVWSALFFLMLISLALGSIFGAFTTVITAFSDQWPVLRSNKASSVLITSLVLFTLGLPFTCNGGIHMFTLFNASAPSWNLILFALLEVVLVSWVYGVDEFMENLLEMNIKMSYSVKTYWKFTLRYTTPAVLLTLLVISWFKFGSVSYYGYVYPTSVQILGYLITGSTVVLVPLIGGLRVLDKYRESTSDLKALVKPTSEWGPNLDSKQILSE